MRGGGRSKGMQIWRDENREIREIRGIREKNADAKGFQNLTTEKIQNTRKECKYGEMRTAPQPLPKEGVGGIGVKLS